MIKEKRSYFKLRLIAIVAGIGVSTGLFGQDKNFHIYLCLGQSNMEGNAKAQAMDSMGISNRFKVLAAVDCDNRGRKMGNWYTAVPPLTRCYTGLSPADYFGRTMVENLPEQVTVGIINVSVGGCKIELFDEDSCASYAARQPDWMKNMIKEYAGAPYQRLVEMARLAQKERCYQRYFITPGRIQCRRYFMASKSKKSI